MAASILAGSACGGQEGELVLVGSVERTALELTAPRSESITEIRVARGEAVEPDQVLVTLDSTLARAEVAREEATLASARTSDRVALHELERAQELRQGGVASEQALENAELRRDEARARLREARARLDATRKRLADLSVATPQAGVVDQLPFEVGERVPAGAVLAIVLASEDPWVRVWIPEVQASRVRPGTSADVRVDGYAEPMTGSVLDVAREPSFTPHYALTERDRVHLVYEARITLRDAPVGLRPGLPADVRLLLDGSGSAP